MTTADEAKLSSTWRGAAFVVLAFVLTAPGASARTIAVEAVLKYPAPTKKPPYPAAVVPIASVSNGCGPGKPSKDPRTFDTSTYLNSNNPLGKRYVINFRAACDLHDAGYTGAAVADKINGGYVDFFGWTKAQVDEKFLDDMRKLCDKIPPEAPVARADCKGRGGKTSVGAESRFNLVDTVGLGYRARPKLRGFWANEKAPDAPAWTVVQTSRAIKASWKGGAGPGTEGRFEGTLISHDPPKNDEVEGEMTFTLGGASMTGVMSFTLSRDDDDRLIMAYAFTPKGPETLVDDKTQGWYNGSLGNALNGTQAQFPPTKNEAGPTLSGAAQPDLSVVSGVLGNWLTNPSSLSGSWSGPRAIPSTWAVGTEDAIVYALAGGAKGVTASFGVDNGIYVWLNGAYKFGAYAPGGVTPGEYSVSLGTLPAGTSYLQILREDHGGQVGYTVAVTGTPSSSGSTILVRQ